jgi:error-prone DNA polymerase
MRAYREDLKKLKVTPARKIREMPTGSRARAAGIMEVLQSPPTKSGKSIYYLLLEDESGLIQATTFSDVHQRDGHHLYRATSFLLEGVVEQDDRRGFSFVVEKIEDLGPLLHPKDTRCAAAGRNSIGTLGTLGSRLSEGASEMPDAAESVPRRQTG